VKRPDGRVTDDLPPSLEPQRLRAERALGMPVRVRGVRTRHQSFRGRALRRQGYILVQYQVAQAGYFWHIPIIEEILARLAAGETEVHLEQAEPPR
jgi:hypothetical protein